MIFRTWSKELHKNSLQPGLLKVRGDLKEWREENIIDSLLF